MLTYPESYNLLSLLRTEKKEFVIQMVGWMGWWLVRRMDLEFNR